MPTLIISDPETGKSRKVEIDDSRMSTLIGRRIGEILDGSIASLPGYKIQLTGGCDKDGIPMRPDIHGGVKGRFILSGGVGYKPKNPGERRKKMVRGNTVTLDTKYLNFKIVARPPSKSTP